MVASAVCRPGRGGEADARSGRERRGACGCPLESRSGAVCQLEDQWIGDEPLSWQSQHSARRAGRRAADVGVSRHRLFTRSEEHTSELQSLMRISYAVVCLKKKT